MAEPCSVNPRHECQTTSGALKLFADGEFRGGRVCPECVEAIRKNEIRDYRIFVMEGREVVVPREEIDV